MLYFITISSSFRKSSLDEIRKKSAFRIVGEFNNFLVIDAKERGLEKKMEKAVFTSSIFPLKTKKTIAKGRYLDGIMSAVTSLKIDKKKGFKLECVDVNSRNGYSAKDIEVRTGLFMERKGYNIDIVNPEILGYVVLLDGICYAGCADYRRLKIKFVNPYRHYHTEKKISRSELKLRQAFDYFGIKGGGTAIDLGAAPGGWSAFLAGRGFRVIAIDNADMDTNAIRSQGLLLISMSDGSKAKEALAKKDIVHIRSGAEAARIRISGISLLTDDMNVDLKSTASAVKPYLRMLSNGAGVVITVKCITRNVPRYLRNVRKELGKELIIKGIKVLPANRQEFTLFAIMRRSPL
jgi:hypothetical protein